MGIGISFFTEAVGAGPRKHMDILGLGMNDGATLRVHPTGKAQLAISVQTQGQGHETTFAQIVAEELGIPPEDVDVIHGDTDVTPYGLGTYGSRSTPVSGAATALVARRCATGRGSSPRRCSRSRRRTWSGRRAPAAGSSRATPSRAPTIQEIAMAARGSIELPDGVEGGLDAEIVYDPPNLTFPFGAYLCVVDIDPDTAKVTVRRFVAVDDCGTRINPMIIEGQIHGGLTDGVGIALMEQIAFDEDGNCLGGSLMDYLIPTALEVPEWETDFTVTPSPHHPIGAKGIGESATVGSPPAIVNAIFDALARYGVRHIDMPCTPGAGVGRDAGRARRPPLWKGSGMITQLSQRTPAGRHEPFVRGHRGPRRRRPACGPATAPRARRRVRSTGSSAASAPSPPCACTRCGRWRPASRCCCGWSRRRRRGRPRETIEGAVVEHNPCLSGGSLEIFLEPHLPGRPVLVARRLADRAGARAVGARGRLRRRRVEAADGRRPRGRRRSSSPRTAAARSGRSRRL